MLKLSCQLMNPWNSLEFKNLFWKGGSFTKNKHWEIEAYTNADVLAGFELDLQWWGHDHAGLKVVFMLFCIEFQAQMYDSRHWDYSAKKWQKYE